MIESVIAWISYAESVDEEIGEEVAEIYDLSVIDEIDEDGILEDVPARYARASRYSRCFNTVVFPAPYSPRSIVSFCP